MSAKSYSPFFLVLWKNEDKFSVIHRQSIADGTIRKECDSKLLSLDELEICFNRRIYNGKLLFAGRTQKEVNAHMKTLEQAQGNSQSVIHNKDTKVTKPSSKKRKAQERLSAIEDVMDTIFVQEETGSDSLSLALTARQQSPGSSQEGQHLESPEDSSSGQESHQVQKLKKRLSKAKRRIETLRMEVGKVQEIASKYKSKAKELQRKLKKYQSDKQTMVDIGNGVMLNSALVERAKLFSSTPAILARNLFRLAFKDTEVRGKSLFGRSCNANKTSSPKPTVDALKRDAVINYCINSLNEDAKQSGTPFEKSIIRGRIVKTLGEYIREVTSKSPTAADREDAEIAVAD